jgi:YVTN family beta-propeller protein
MGSSSVEMSATSMSSGTRSIGFHRWPIVVAITLLAVAALPTGAVVVGPEPSRHAAPPRPFVLTGPLEARGVIQVADSGKSVHLAAPGVVATIPVGNFSGPEPPAYDSATGDLFVPEYDADNVSVIDGDSEQVVATVTVGIGPIAAVYDPTNNLVYVVNSESDDVSILSGSNDSLVTSVGVGSYPDAPTLVPASGDVYVSNYDSGNVSVISAVTDQVVTSIGVGDEPDQPVLDTTNGDLYVANDLYISVLDPSDNTLIDTIRLPSDLGLNPPVFDSGTGDLYFTEALGSNVLVLSGENNSFVGNVAVAASSGSTAVLDPMTNDLYVVTNEGTSSASNITIVSTTSNTVVGSIRTPGVPQAPVLDAFDGNLYFPEQNQTDLLNGIGGGNVSVVNGVDVEATLPVGADPLTPTYDPATHDVYVANWDSATPATVSVISPTGTSEPGPLTIDSFAASPSAVVENQTTILTVDASGGTGDYGYAYSGLPPGCTNQNTSSLSCSPGALGSFTVNVTVTDSDGHSLQRSTGLVVIPMPSPGTYDVVFEESGLPPGHAWSVTLAGSPPASSLASYLTQEKPNGSYSYTIGSVSGYSVTPSTGTLLVAGSTVIQSISFRSTSTSGPANAGWLGLPGNEGVLLIAALVAVAAAVALTWLWRQRHRGKMGPASGQQKARRESVYDPPAPPPPPPSFET